MSQLLRRLRHIFTIITAAKEKFSSNGPNCCLVPFLLVLLAFIVLTMLDGFATFINQLYCKTHTPWYCTSLCPVGLTLHITHFLDMVCYWRANYIDNNDSVWKAWHVSGHNRMWCTLTIKKSTFEKLLWNIELNCLKMSVALLLGTF